VNETLLETVATAGRDVIYVTEMHLVVQGVQPRPTVNACGKMSFIIIEYVLTC